MSRHYHIALCGQSVFLTAIEAGLAALPEVEVTRFNPHLPALTSRILALEPSLVVIESETAGNPLILTCLKWGLPVIELTAADNRGMVMTGQKISITGADDLVRLMAQVETPQRQMV